MLIKGSKENIFNVNESNQTFEVIGRIVPKYDGRQWTYSEELLNETYMKAYPNDDLNWNEYIDNENKVIFFAFENNKCVAQIILRKDWNLYAFIEDISVSNEYRGRGIGTKLIEQAKHWATDGEMKGLALETQDNNILACRFYQKCGFEIGAVNTMLYKNFGQPYCDEIAIYWYMKFD